MLEIDLDHFALAMDYIEGGSDRDVSAGELALIYSVLPELMLELISPDGLMLTVTNEE
ncbi:MAG: hypothetical protein ACREVC_12135 [Burkholderiales bacterium]